MTNITKIHLPDRQSYMAYVEEIFDNGWVTNNGPLVRRLEQRLADYLGVKHVVLVANGTAALEIAYRTLGLKGEVITTPFSFVATTTSLLTNCLQPIFADIDKETLNIDPEKIEPLITDKTSAIVPVHVFGNVCDVSRIEAIAKRHGLKVVYDASHTFDVEYQGESVFKHGDISTLSLHATKIFHTIEGGALIINDERLVEKARRIINFGIKDSESIPDLGTNAKMNEFEAAMGLSILDDVTRLIERRQVIHDRYKSRLEGNVQFQIFREDATHNYSYFPIILTDEKQLLTVKKALEKREVYARRYFYPSLDSLSYIRPEQRCERSRDIASRVLCLPIYPELEDSEQEMIIESVLHSL